MGGGGNRQPTFSAKARKKCSRAKKRSRLYNRLVEQPGRPERPPFRRAEQRRRRQYQPNRTASKYLAIKREERHMDENVTITRDYSRNQPSDSTMSHQILYARSNSGRAGLSTASIVHDLLMLYLALMIFDRSCGFDVVHQYKAVNEQ